MLVIPAPSALEEHVGKEVGVSDWVLIDQARIDRFAEVTEDWQWIHVDVARAAAERPAGKTVAHGFLSLSLLSRFVNAVVRVDAAKSIVSMGLGVVRFISPVSADSRLRGRVRLREITMAPEFVSVLWRVTGEVDGVRLPVFSADWTVRYYV